MRKKLVAVTTLVLAFAVFSYFASAAGGPHLDGKFKVTETVGDNDYTPQIPEGSKIEETFIFNATCNSGACRKVKLTRKGSTRRVKSTLHKVRKGVYKGTEGPENYVCVNPLGDPGTFTNDIKVRVTKTVDGDATKIAGNMHVELQGCDETFEDSKFTGKLAH